MAFVVAGAGFVVTFVMYKLFDFVSKENKSTEILGTMRTMAEVMQTGGEAKRKALEHISVRLDKIESEIRKIEEELWTLKKK